MIDLFMFLLNLSIIFGASTSESPQHHHQVTTPSVQKSQITSVRKHLRLAMIEVELLEYNHTNRSFIKTGITHLFNASFSRLGTKDNVESGFLRQVHICQDEYDWASNMPWIVVFKLEPSVHRKCKNVITKAKLALTNRASAVIFDVSLDTNVSKLLNRKAFARLTRPVLIIRGRAAKKLQLLMQNHSAAVAKIKLPEVTASPFQNSDYELLGNHGYLTLVISFTVVGFLFAVAVALTIKTLGKRPPLRQALKNMRLVVYSEIKENMTDTQCSICFDDYQPSEVVRLLPCLHFFHKKCVDRWLLSKKTCPLCLLDVMSGRGQTISRYNTRQSTSVSSGLPTYPTSVDTPALCRLCTSLPSHMTTQTIHCTHFSDSSFLSPCCSDIRASTSPNKSSLHSYTP